METIILKRRPEADGTLTISVPAAFRDIELDVGVVLQPVDETGSEALDENGWPVGFFESTYGSLADDPIRILPLDR